MIRRPPTIIALEEKDVESHLQRIYIRHTLTVEFEQLHLESCDETDPYPSSCISTDSDVDIDTTGLSQNGSCFESTSPRYNSHASADAILHSSVSKSCLKYPTQHSSVQVTIPIGVYSQADRFVDPPRLKVKFALSPQACELELHSGKAVEEEIVQFSHGENHRPSHTDAIYTPMSIDSPASTPQVSFLSCGVSSSPAASVPPRDLTLASTMSYEAVLADEAVSPASAANSISEDCGSHTKIAI
ncbi:hypothetical protein DTO027I6_1966 [Penicillium roqueforti]|nr:hypothetical protein CBS147354_3420 [Penicillium roqueforti]KAI3106143.1 hypothetical protein CBS147333_6705 [Penicillium roqueforti]KAI3140750.1 hypothetical protein CBS147326_2451 [Penicillium roqueforti]KAI3219261.1 hypothetical protein DTO027I6_1966 [Penicillium roqueforti]KAI3241093.1 hypothetical protein DTO012A7_2792 [Penicillium roqueforti]